MRYKSKYSLNKGIKELAEIRNEMENTLYRFQRQYINKKILIYLIFKIMMSGDLFWGMKF